MTAQLQAVGPALATARPEAPRPGQGRQWWRRSRPWIGGVALIIIAGVIIGLLSQQPVNSYLNPASTDATGTHALADVLTGLGRRVTTVTSAGAAAADATGGSVIVVTSPYYLTRPQLTALARARGDVVLVEPDSRTLAAFRTGLRLATTGAAVASIPAACTLYERCGFKATGERQPRPSDPARSEIEMMLTL